MDTDGGTTSSSTSTVSMTSVGDTSTVDDTTSEATTTTGEDTTTTDGDTTGAPPPQCPPEPDDWQCSIAHQDCPEGYKCLPWDDEGMIFEPSNSVCAPVDESPGELYDACTYDLASCSDDCPDGALCLSLYDEGGTCLDMCTGDDFLCPGDQVCATCSSCAGGWCLPVCNPLAPNCPDSVGRCALHADFSQYSFSCGGFDPPMPTVPGDPCPFGACTEGQLCIYGDYLGPECTQYCCAEPCDRLDPGFVCSDPAFTCIGLFIPGQAHIPSQENIGVCGPPEADPCNTPGLCPPSGIDDTYPWCSLDNDYACSGSFGYSDTMQCEQGCSCVINCAVDAECPVPTTGTATPVCLDNGPGTANDRCVLPCGGGQTCPDGMQCAPEWGDICMWISGLPAEEC